MHSVCVSSPMWRLVLHMSAQHTTHRNRDTLLPPALHSRLDAALGFIIEHLVCLGGLLQRGAVRDHKGGVQLALLQGWV